MQITRADLGIIRQKPSSRQFLIIFPLIVAAIFSFSYAYYKQVNYQNFQAAASQAKEAASDSTLPLVSPSGKHVSNLSVASPPPTAAISNSTSSDQPAAATSPVTNSKTTLQANSGIKSTGQPSTKPLQSNANINDPKLSNNPYVRSLESQY